MKKISILFILLFFLRSVLFGQHVSKLVVPERIQSLLNEMTLQEKIGQMVQLNGFEENYRSLIKQGKIGSLLNVKGAEHVNEIQKIAVEESRLSIPIIFGLDVIHGYRTIFPIPLGETATWDPDLIEKAARIAAQEATASGITWTFCPMVDIARDARWGRIAEGAGEDPYLGSIMAQARVKGFQGKSLTDPSTMVACPKHFVAYGAAIAGKDYNTVDISLPTLYNIYLPPFKAAIDAGAKTLMCAFNDLNGIPCTANKYILTDILRDNWNFDGFVVSDWRSIEQLIPHGIAGSKREAARLAINAGVDMDMVDDSYQENISDLVESGDIQKKQIDEAVERILNVKYSLGLFERPYVEEQREQKEILTAANRKLAREVAVKSIVLLKNKKSLLPLKKDLKSIAIIGPLVKDKRSPLGSWSCDGQEADVINVYDGVKNIVSSKTTIHYEKGCDIDSENISEISKAVDIVQKSDVAIVVVGESKEMSGEGGSRATIDLPGKQLELIKTIHQTKTPYVVIIMCGRPLAIPWIAEHSPAVLITWQLGVECGNAIADILFGDVNPSGKLPVSFPQTTGQEPLFYNSKNTGRPGVNMFRFTSKYFDLPTGPQFPFGFGLSYTKFKYSNLKINKQTMKPDESIVVSAVVKNVGKLKGDEVVQLYIRDIVASLTRPIRELKGFKTITLSPEEEMEIHFTLSAKDLGFYNHDLKFVVEPGEFNVWIGPNSSEGLMGRFNYILE